MFENSSVQKGRTPEAPEPQYAEIFAKRGQEYNLSMQRYPQARAKEFEAAIAAIKPRARELICDAPSGGGYLARHMNPDLQLRVVEVDPTDGFQPQAGAAAPAGQPIIAPLNEIPLNDGACDAIVSIAGLHHANNLNEIFTEFRRLLSSRGRVVILEVAEGSPVDRFLNGFVDTHCSLGHKGVFVNTHFYSQLDSAGLTVQHDDTAAYTWDFVNTDAMADFARLIFGLDLADKRQIIQGIGDILGFSEAQGGCQMHWQLRQIIAR